MMSNVHSTIFIIICYLLSSCSPTSSSKKPFTLPKIEYPTTRVDSVIDDYHGHQIADPFRWLEDDHADDTKAWVGAQNEVTEEFLNEIPYRDLLQKRLEEAWNYERYGVPSRHGSKY